jgi:hypothetical protein
VNEILFLIHQVNKLQVGLISLFGVTINLFCHLLKMVQCEKKIARMKEKGKKAPDELELDMED